MKEIMFAERKRWADNRGFSVSRTQLQFNRWWRHFSTTQCSSWWAVCSVPVPFLCTQRDQFEFKCQRQLHSSCFQVAWYCFSSSRKRQRHNCQCFRVGNARSYHWLFHSWLEMNGHHLTLLSIRSWNAAVGHHRCFDSATHQFHRSLFLRQVGSMFVTRFVFVASSVTQITSCWDTITGLLTKDQDGCLPGTSPEEATRVPSQLNLSQYWDEEREEDGLDSVSHLIKTQNALSVVARWRQLSQQATTPPQMFLCCIDLQNQNEGPPGCDSEHLSRAKMCWTSECGSSSQSAVWEKMVACPQDNNRRRVILWFMQFPGELWRGCETDRHFCLKLWWQKACPGNPSLKCHDRGSCWLWALRALNPVLQENN